MAKPNDTQNLSVEQPSETFRSTIGQLYLLENYLRCQVDLNAGSHSCDDAHIQINQVHFGAFFEMLLVQVESIRHTFQREYPCIMSLTVLQDNAPVPISSKRLDGLLDGLVAQLHHIRNTCGVQPFTPIIVVDEDEDEDEEDDDLVANDR